MVFSSNTFLFVFLPAALLLYYLSPRGVRLVVLTGCSYAFYAWSDPRFVLLLLWVTLVDFVCGNVIGGHWRVAGLAGLVPGWVRRGALGFSLLNTLGLLMFFKYAPLGEAMLNAARAAVGAAAWPALGVVLPAGISFYTFESISYVVDVYRGVTRPAGERFVASLPPRRRSSLAWRVGAEARAFGAFACYLAQFPHLVAGPIIRYQELAPQLERPSGASTTVERFASGCFFLSLGLAKKVLVADTVARAVGPAFGGLPVGWAEQWWGTLAYAFQIYFDFSGYSDMAVGLALMLGFDFPRNFDAPYRAQSVSEFWRRWHMTLSRWLRDYLYVPLGGNRRGRRRTYVNLLVTMGLGGLWHGASWNFAAWGLYHGAWLAAERAGGKRGVAARLPAFVRVGVTFVIVCVGWVLFRSDDVREGVDRVVRLFVPMGYVTTPERRAVMYDPQVVLAMAAAAGLAFAGVQTWDLARRITPAKMVWAVVLFCASVVVLEVNASTPFLYFRF